MKRWRAGMGAESMKKEANKDARIWPRGGVAGRWGASWWLTLEDKWHNGTYTPACVCERVLEVMHLCKEWLHKHTRVTFGWGQRQGLLGKESIKLANRRAETEKMKRKRQREVTRKWFWHFIWPDWEVTLCWSSLTAPPPAFSDSERGIDAKMQAHKHTGNSWMRGLTCLTYRCCSWNRLFGHCTR